MCRPASITVGEAGKAVDSIRQVVEFVGNNESDKRRKLEHLLINGPSPPIIIFTNTRKSCDGVAKTWTNSGYVITIINEWNDLLIYYF